MTSPAERYQTFLSTLTPQTLADLPKFVTDDVHFRDPFNDVRGADNMRRVFEHMFENLEDITFTIRHAADNADTRMIEWRFESRLRGRDWGFDGMSLLTFSADGRVNAHFDYWDAASAFYTRIPLLGCLLQLLRRRISVSAG